MNRLSRRFFARETLVVAQALLGRTLVHESPEGTVAGRIVEVEAYRGFDDPGSHAFRGPTRRNATMFGPPGHLYVYFTYGMHDCANVVCEREGVAGAVLLRAVEPTLGLPIMAKRRGTEDPHLLARGPGRLCRAFGIDRRHDGADLIQGEIWVSVRRTSRGGIKASERIGLAFGGNLSWRFYEEGPWVTPSSRGAPLRSFSPSRFRRRPVGA
jgi:DNA-3-methyladenine glycosylase